MRHFSTGFLLLLWSALSFAWDSHFLLTAHTLNRLLSNKDTVVYRTLEEALSSDLPHFSSKTPQALRTELKIQKAYAFPNKLHEARGMGVSVEKILSTYSDEPDWGLDQNLFEPGQYPELWTDDSPYMAQRTGLKSQGFRHLYFPGKFDWLSPLVTFQIPQHPIGQGPDRAVLYYQLALDLLKAKRYYWGLRFLAWSLHYVQDLIQPWHVCQTPTKRLLVLNWNHLLPSIDIPATGENIGYYHLSYEKWIEEKVKAGTPTLIEALESQKEETFQFSREAILTSVVQYSNHLAPAVGSLSYRLFGPFDPRGGVKAEDAVGTPDWQKKIQEGELSQDLLGLTREAFARLSAVTRQIVHEPLSFLPKPG